MNITAAPYGRLIGTETIRLREWCNALVRTLGADPGLVISPTKHPRLKDAATVRVREAVILALKTRIRVHRATGVWTEFDPTQFAVPENCRLSYPEIGKVMNMNHSTIVLAWQRMERRKEIARNPVSSGNGQFAGGGMR